MATLPTLKLYKPDGSYVVINADDEEQLALWRGKGYTLDTPEAQRAEPEPEPDPPPEAEPEPEPAEEVNDGPGRRRRKRAQ
jgi:hypothetical protein